MKKRGWMDWTFAAAIAFGLLTIALYYWPQAADSDSEPSFTEPPSVQAADNKIKIGFANLTDDVLFPQKVEHSIEREAAQYGIELLTADNRMDGATALQNAERFIDEHVDLVIEFQTDERYGNIIMDRLRLADIPVIAVDIPMPGAVFFGADNYRAGFMSGTALGNAIRDKWQGKLDRLFMLELPQSGPIPAARLQGQRDGLESVIGPVPENRVIHLDSKNTYEESEKLTAAELKKLPAGTKMAFVNINDDTALGCLKAVERAGRSDDALIVGQNGTEPFLKELREHDTALVGSTAYFPEQYGDRLIPAAIKIVKGEQVPPYLFTDHVFIDRHNVDQYASQP